MAALVEPRQTQTKVKHIILKRYLAAWGGIIVGGNRGAAKHAEQQGRPFELHLMYVDCDASCGRYSGDAHDIAMGGDRGPVFGSPIIGVQALDDLVSWAQEKHGMHIRTNSILIERERGRLNELNKSLDMNGLLSRVQYTDKFESLKDGEIAVICGDSTELDPLLINYTKKKYTYSLYFIDPYGAEGHPMRFVRQIIKNDRHDAIVFFNFSDLNRKSGFINKLNVDSKNIKQLEHYDVVFDDQGKWRHIAQKLHPENMAEYNDLIPTTQIPSVEILFDEGNDPELEIMYYYRSRLLSVDPGLKIKSIPLHFAGTDKTIYYLYLTTHDPTGALTMNEILYKASAEENKLRWELKMSKKSMGQMFMDLDFLYNRSQPRPSTSEISNDIHGRLRKRILNRRDVLSVLVDTFYSPGEVDKALRHLRNENKAFFKGTLTHNTIIEFT